MYTKLRIFQVLLTVNSGYFLLSLMPFLNFHFINVLSIQFESWNGTIPCGQINDQFEHCFFVFFYERRKSCTQNASQLRIFQVFLTVNSGYFLLSLMPFLNFHFINVLSIRFKLFYFYFLFSFVPFFVFDNKVTKMWKYYVFVYILQGKMGKTEKTRKKIMQLKWQK